MIEKKLSIIENICLRLRSLRMKSKGNLDIFLKFETFFQHKKLNFMENLKEELIILSNVTLAEKVLEFFPNCTELRKTRYLKVDDFSKIFQFSKFLSINLDYSSFKKLIKNKTVYLTFDVDGLDSSIMPATGTPEPGGLLWDETLDIIKIAAKNSKIVGADINELSPIKGFNSYNFLVAKLAYKILSYKFLY